MLLSSGEFRDTLSRHLSGASDSIVILSAFTKLRALEWIIGKSGTKSISVVARWLPGDLISGVSDIDCYNLCREHDIKFGISLGLHGKVYCTDGQILIGSANLTSRGLALSEYHNDEFGYCFAAGDADVTKLKKYLETVTWLDDQLFTNLVNELEKLQNGSPVQQPNWSAELLTKLTRPVEFLWVHEMPFSEPQYFVTNQNRKEESVVHDLELFGLSPGTLSIGDAVDRFQTTKAFRWLCETIGRQGSISFGGLTQALHTAILDDPTPYRTEVKHLVARLFDWAENCPDIFAISRPRHSKIIAMTQMKRSQ